MTKKSRDRRVARRKLRVRMNNLLGCDLNEARNAYIDYAPQQYDWPMTIEFRDKLDAVIKEWYDAEPDKKSYLDEYSGYNLKPFKAGKIDCLVFGKRP